MEDAVLIAAATVLSTLVSLAIASFYIKKAEKQTVDLLKSGIQAAIDTVNTSLTDQLDPILKTNSQAMGIIGSIGAQTKKAQAVEREVFSAIKEDLPITPDMIRQFSPKLGDMLEENPQMIGTAIQAYNKIMGGGQPTDQSYSSRPHPLAGKEEK